MEPSRIVSFGILATGSELEFGLIPEGNIWRVMGEEDEKEITFPRVWWVFKGHWHPFNELL